MLFSLLGALLADLIGFALRSKLKHYDSASLPFALIWALIIPSNANLIVAFSGSFWAIMLSYLAFNRTSGTLINPLTFVVPFCMLAWPNLLLVVGPHESIMPNSYNNLALLSQNNGAIPGILKYFMGFNGQLAIDSYLLYFIFLAIVLILLNWRSLPFVLAFLLFYTLLEFLLLGGATLFTFASFNNLYLSNGFALACLCILTLRASSPALPLAQLMYALLLALVMLFFKEFLAFPVPLFYAIFFSSFFMPAFDKLAQNLVKLSFKEKNYE
jgi:Na+-translocating ferredoxin:NAD+ oxidoreductase RnfD subunit